MIGGRRRCKEEDNDDMMMMMMEIDEQGKTRRRRERGRGCREGERAKLEEAPRRALASLLTPLSKRRGKESERDRGGHTSPIDTTDGETRKRGDRKNRHIQ